MSAPISKYYSIKYEKEIGKGVSGCVYQAIKKSDGLLSAVKIITRSKLSKDAVTAIANEVQALRSLNHPHIVRLYDMFEDRSHFYLAMEFIQGGELFDRISKKTCYNELEAKTCCRIILSAVKHCHDNNIVHRDLKPENLLLEGMNDDTNIKLVDFGFAASAPDNTLTGILGTPIYMAPEIWSNQPYGKPVDMWAFGVITYILLGGYPPFSDERREKLVQRIRLAKFAFHNEFWSQISQEAKDFITALLNPDFSTRLTVDQAAQHPWVRFVKKMLVIEMTRELSSVT
jgi:serine/threonine protein kinase